MKSYRLLFPVAFLFLLGFSFCKKINEATDLGGDVIPVVDNIRTFEVALASETDNLLFDDSTRAIIGDQFALGHINDPVFGQTFADIYFNVSQGPAFNGVYPFINKDSVWVDSVILSLAYTSPYGDTNSMQTVSVHEIAPGSGFADSNYYYSGTRQASFPTTGAVLGTKTFTISQLNDTISHIRRRDTTKLVNVLRIPLPNSLGERITAFDTAKTANGGFYDDSLFKTLFKGFKVQSESSTGNGGLAYFNVGASETKLVVYFRATKNGATDTTSFSFRQYTRGQANIIRRQNSGDYAAALNNPATNEEKLYIQSAPGSYASVVIPELTGFGNRVIHRAELIAYRIPSSNPASDDIFTPPNILMLDRVKNGTAYVLDNDLTLSALPGGGISGDFDFFGGRLRSDTTYRFNITRYVQTIATRGASNDTLRIYAPFETVLFAPAAQTNVRLTVNPRIAAGRVVLAGGNYPDPALRLRLRIIYTTL